MTTPKEMRYLLEYGNCSVPYATFRAVPIWLRFRGDIRIWKTTPRISDTGSRQLRITDTRSRLLNFLKENSLYRWYGESSTHRTSDTVSRRLSISLSQRVADSAYHRYGESKTPHIVESGSRRLRGSVIRESLFKEKINLVSIFRTFNG